jgi:metallo-beta-lactamase family protein
MGLRVKFLGALGTVTGSCSLVHYEPTDSYFLVDCGSYQGLIGADERNRRPFDFDPKRLSAVFLTHAHIDHCGLLPRLVEEGFEGKVICTRVTAEMTRNALKDAATIEHEFSPTAVDLIQFRCPDDKKDFLLGHYYPLEADLFYSFLRTNHVTGAVAVGFRQNLPTRGNVTLLFGGDIGTSTDGTLHGGLAKPRQYPDQKTDFIVCESTYGGRCREPGVETYPRRTGALANALKAAFKAGDGSTTLIFPCFALQRTQELLLDLHFVLDEASSPADTNFPRLPIYVDSPLATAHTSAMLEEFERTSDKGKPRFLNDAHPMFLGKPRKEVLSILRRILGGGVHPAAEPHPSSWLDVRFESPNGSADAPKIVIASSGMCNGGRVVRHLREYLRHESTTVIFTGHQSSGTPGAALLKLVETPPEEREDIKFKLGEEEWTGDEVKAQIFNLGPFFSGHADQEGLIDFILRKDRADRSYHPVTVFLTHGDNGARQALKEKLEERAKLAPEQHRPLQGVHLPKLGDGWFDLDRREWVTEPAAPTNPASLETLMREVRDSNLRIIELLQELVGSRKR